MDLSPKAYVPALIAVLVGVALWFITGDKSALIITLTGLAGGGIAAIAPPAPGVKQADVEALAIRKRRRR